MSGAIRLHGGDREKLHCLRSTILVLFKIPFNIIVPSAHAFWKRFFSYRSYHLYSVSIYFPPRTCHMQGGIIVFDVVTRMILLTKSPMLRNGVPHCCGNSSVPPSLGTVTHGKRKSESFGHDMKLFTSQQVLDQILMQKKSGCYARLYVTYCYGSLLSNKLTVINFNKTVSTVFHAETHRTWEWGPDFAFPPPPPGCECWNWMTH